MSIAHAQKNRQIAFEIENIIWPLVKFEIGYAMTLTRDSTYIAQYLHHCLLLVRNAALMLGHSS